MKSKLSAPTRKKMTLAEAEALAKRDKRRLMLLGLGLVVLLVGYFYALSAENQDEPVVSEPLPGVDVVRDLEDEQVSTLPFDQMHLLEGIRDGTPEHRLTVNGEALTALLYYTKLLTFRNYKALGIRDLVSSISAELSRDPAAARVAPLRARGELLSIFPRRREGAKFDEYYGTLRLDDGSHAHFVFTTAPSEPLTAGDHVVIEGVFVQMLRAETADGWVDAPLIASRDMLPSCPPSVLLEPAELRRALIDSVEDDQLEDVTGVRNEPLDQLMLMAAEHGATEDWEEALVLDNEALNRLMQDGEPFRGVPFTIPISRNLGAWTERYRENGLRLEKVTKGWIGNFTWKGASALIQWIGPFDKPDLDDRYGGARLISARGYFFKNIYYLKRDQSPHRVPLFVMSEVNSFTPVHNPTPSYILYGVLMLTLGMIALVFFLLRRDRISSERLQQDLVRRRRARQEREQAGVESP